MTKFFRYIRHQILELVRLLLSYIIPVKKGKIFFQSFPDYSDNARALSDFIVSNTDCNVYWAVNNPEHFLNRGKIIFVKNNDGNIMDKLRYVYHTVSAQYLFSTHGAFLYANKKRQTFVCCWHGMPLKKIAQWQNPDNKNYLNNARYILSTSKFYIPILCKCFGKNEAEILPTGYPRNDWLFQESDVLDVLEFQIKKDEKLIMYLPTFRRQAGDYKADSNNDILKNGCIDFTSEEAISKLNLFLIEHKLKLIVKPHPKEINQLNVKRMSNILVIPHQYFLDSDIQLNKVLHYADALITDFSGAFVDYLTLNRPIGFVLTDLDEYNENRGFVFYDPLEKMPGMKIFNEQDFKRFCIQIAKGLDEYIGERAKLYHVYNDYADGDNCERLAKYLKIEIK